MAKAEPGVLRRRDEWSPIFGTASWRHWSGNIARAASFIDRDPSRFESSGKAKRRVSGDGSFSPWPHACPSPHVGRFKAGIAVTMIGAGSEALGRLSWETKGDPVLERVRGMSRTHDS